VASFTRWRKPEITHVFVSSETSAALQLAIEFFCDINPLTPELNPSAQRCLTRNFTGDFAS
jgi:hypothetical protein